MIGGQPVTGQPQAGVRLDNQTGTGVVLHMLVVSPHQASGQIRPDDRAHAASQVLD